MLKYNDNKANFREFIYKKKLTNLRRRKTTKISFI